jgi:hypothetical protein
MSERTFRLALGAVMAFFTVAFVVLVFPALVDDGGDIFGAAGDGFANPYSSAYSFDVLCSYAVLTIWVVWERRTRRQRYGWVCLLLGLVPGLAVGFGSYLLLRTLRPGPGPEY